jgi:hypothetical protein
MFVHRVEIRRKHFLSGVIVLFLQFDTVSLQTLYRRGLQLIYLASLRPSKLLTYSVVPDNTSKKRRCRHLRIGTSAGRRYPPA